MAMTPEAFDAACKLAASVGEKYADLYWDKSSAEALQTALQNNAFIGITTGEITPDEDQKLKGCFNQAFEAKRNSQKGNGNLYLTIGVGIGGLLLGGIIGYVMRGSDKSSASS